MAELSLVNVSKRFGAIQAVDGLTLAMASGEFVVLLGPSGAGKTTTLRIVAGLEQADRGSVHIGGRDVSHAAPALRDFGIGQLERRIARRGQAPVVETQVQAVAVASCAPPVSTVASTRGLSRLACEVAKFSSQRPTSS